MRRSLPRKKSSNPQLFDVELILNEPETYCYPFLTTELQLIHAKRVTTFNNGPYWLFKGVSLAKVSSDNNKYAIALDYFLSGARNDPTFYPCNYNLAVCYFNDQKFANALRWFKRAFEIDPTQ